MLNSWMDVIDRSLGEEGGYVNDPADPGGETNWGISKRECPDEDIKNLTRAEAVRLYYNYYWVEYGVQQLPLSLGFQVFDWGINAGMATAVRGLQTVAGVPADGKVGPQTCAAVASMPLASVLMQVIASREAYYTILPGWPSFGKGWTNRVIQCLRWAAQDLIPGPPVVGQSAP